MGAGVIAHSDAYWIRWHRIQRRYWWAKILTIAMDLGEIRELLAIAAAEDPLSVVAQLRRRELEEILIDWGEAWHELFDHRALHRALKAKAGAELEPELISAGSDETFTLNGTFTADGFDDFAPAAFADQLARGELIPFMLDNRRIGTVKQIEVDGDGWSFAVEIDSLEGLEPGRPCRHVCCFNEPGECAGEDLHIFAWDHCPDCWEIDDLHGESKPETDIRAVMHDSAPPSDTTGWRPSDG